MTAPVALISGASRGIGKQLAIDLARAGYDVACLARSTAENPSKVTGTVDETAKLVRAEGRRAIALGADVRSETQLQDAVTRVYEEFGGVDVLINNAGIAPWGSVLAMPTRLWQVVIEVNLFGALYLTRATCPRMLEAGGGRVVNISSAAAGMAIPEGSAYAASKRGLEALTEVFAREVDGRGLAVNALRVDVPVWSEGFGEVLGGDTGERLEEETAGMQFEHPIVVSDACLWLLDQPPSFTGQVVRMSALRAEGIVRPETLFDRS